MSRWIGFGKEASDGRNAPPVFYPALRMDEESCDYCGTIETRARMTYVHSYADGTAIYFCSRHASLLLS